MAEGEEILEEGIRISEMERMGSKVVCNQGLPLLGLGYGRRVLRKMNCIFYAIIEL